MNEFRFGCSRCGDPFPPWEEVEAGAAWVVVDESGEVVCPNCATPLDRLHEELDALLDG